MIPIDEKFIPRVIRNKIWLRLIVSAIALLLVAGAIYYYLQQFSKEMQQGPDHSTLRLTITWQLFDSAAVGLERFRRAHGHYPQMQGKYFLDSIKSYIGFIDTYVYADTITAQGDTIPLKHRGRWFHYMNRSLCYFGISWQPQTIIYKSLSGSAYRMYSVGENYQDEDGHGDDIVYKKDR